jgi:hypothetical protein
MNNGGMRAVCARGSLLYRGCTPGDPIVAEFLPSRHDFRVRLSVFFTLA